MDSAFPDSKSVPPHPENLVCLRNAVEGEFTYPEYEWMDISFIRDSLAQFKNSKSPGPDLFKPRILKQLPDVALERLKQLNDNPLNPRQNGFRKGLSTDTALSMTLGKIEKGLSRKKGCVPRYLGSL